MRCSPEKLDDLFQSASEFGEGKSCRREPCGDNNPSPPQQHIRTIKLMQLSSEDPKSVVSVPNTKMGSPDQEKPSYF